MDRFSKLSALLLSLCLTATLCACGSNAGAGDAAAQSTPAVSGGVVAGVGDIPGEDAPDETPAPAETDDPEKLPVLTDGLEGSYYNDYLRQTLTLDGSGGATLAAGGEESEGSYVRDESGALTLTLGGKQESGSVDVDGDILISGRSGYFLRNWSFWGITPSETGGGSAALPGSVSILENEDGTMRCRDFDNGIAFTYPAGMNVLNGRLIGGVAVTDGKGGYVTGRNVTDLYFTHKGTDDEFIEDYVRTFVYTDFAQLYDSVRGFEPLTLLHDGVDGRLAAATLTISGGAEKIAVKVLLYTSTYPDGTVNRICKTVFAPAGENGGGYEALEKAVTDMGAVRLVADA